jgi:Ca2+-binding EF-hand superfamily protein
MDAFCIALRRLAVTLVVAGPVLAGALTGAAPPLELVEADSDVHHLVLLAPGHPVFIQVRVQVDGRGLRSVRTAHAAKLLEQYDKDGDKLLDRNEAKAIPPLVKSASASGTVSIADRWEAVDVSPADDKVSVEELAAYVDRVFGGTFLLSVRPQSAAQSVDLFPLLDLNHDGRLSRDELEAAPYSLHKLDLDDDETYTIDELQPGRNPQVGPQVPAVAANQATEQPFLLLDDAESIERAAQELQRRYGGTEPGSQSARMNREVLGLDEASFVRHDASGDGMLDAIELASFLRTPDPHLVIDVQLPRTKAGKPRLTISEDQIGAAAKSVPAGPGKLSLSMKGIDIELKAATVKSGKDASDNRSFYANEFRRVGGSKKGYLSEEEFAGLRLQNAEFRSVDTNGDGMIVVEELLAYVEQESASSQSRVEMSISHNGQSAFEVIDENKDRRLTRRELRNAYDRLGKLDRDGDGVITAIELVGRFQGTLELGRPVLFQRPTAINRGDTTAPLVNVPTAGPDWFRKMDRNRDGDLSPREFLGSPAQFKKLDADGDGLISAAEAEQAAALGSAAAR